MATINLKASNCSSGGHLHTQASLNGVARGEQEMFTGEEISEPITQLELRACMRTLLKVYRMGKTPLQTRNGIVAGIDIEVP